MISCYRDVPNIFQEAFFQLVTILPTEETLKLEKGSFGGMKVFSLAHWAVKMGWDPPLYKLIAIYP